jgi:hypothetical protein
MKIWVLIAGVNLTVVLLTAVVQIRTNAPMLHQLFTDPSVFSRPVGTTSLTWVLYPLMMLAGAIYWASFRAIREVDDNGPRVSFEEAKSLMISRLVPTGLATLAFGLVTGLGTMCCIIPGLVAMYFFYMAPYLAAEGMSVGDAFRESSERAKRHAPLVLLLVAILVIAGIGSGLVQAVAIAACDGAMGPSGMLVGSVIAWAMSSIAGYFMWLYSGAVFVTISKAEENMRPGTHLPLA